MNAARIRAVIVDGPVDDATLALIRDAIASPRLRVVFARPRTDEIVRQVSHEMGVSIPEIVGHGRGERGVRARCAIAWLAYRLTGDGRKAIGDVIRRDPSAVFAMLRRADALRDTDPAFERLTDRLYEHFSGERP
jgi:chromosomal replication initiation ATPase DnaA